MQSSKNPNNEFKLVWSPILVVHQKQNKWNGVEVDIFNQAEAWNPKTMCYLRLRKYGVYFNFYLIKNRKNTWKMERNSIWTFKVEHEEVMQAWSHL